MAIEIGNKQVQISGASSDGHLVSLNYGQNKQWAQTMAPGSIGQWFWPIRMGATIGMTSGATREAKLCIWRNDPPGTLAATTAYETVPLWSGDYDDAVGQMFCDLTTTSVLPPSGTSPSVLGVAPKAAPLCRIQRSDSYNYRAYNRTVNGGPTDPFGTPNVGIDDGSTARYSGLCIWMEGQYNSAPSAPVDVSIDGVVIPTGSGGLNIVNNTPTITGLFRDVDEILYDGSRVVINMGFADKLNQYKIIVRNASTGSIVRNLLYDASPTEQANRQFSRTLTSLTAGSYLLEVSVSDQAGEWSSVTSRNFSIALATSEAIGPPSGKITDTTPDTFGHRFNFSGSAASKIQIRLKKNGVVFATSNEVNQTTTPNQSSSVSWASLGMSAIPHTGTLTYEVRHWYNGSLWTDWSTGAEFLINQPPNKPSNLSPNGGSFGTYATFLATIIDPDDASDTLTATLEIIRPDASTTGFVSSVTYRGNNRWGYTGNSAVFNQYGTYKFRMKGTDSSGAVGDWSDYSSFIFANVPSVIITGVNPVSGGKVTSPLPAISFTTDGTSSPTTTQQKRRKYIIYKAGTNIIVNQRGFETSSNTTMSVTGSLLEQGDYEVVVLVQNSSDLVGESSRFPFTIEFPPPVSLTGMSAQPVALINEYPNRMAGTAVAWEISTINPIDFRRYDIARVENGVHIIVGEVTNQSQTSWIDSVPPPNTEVTYAVRQVVVSSAGDDVPSGWITAISQVVVDSAILTDPFTGESVSLKIPAEDGIEELLIVDIADLEVRSKADRAIWGIKNHRQLQIETVLHPEWGGVPDSQAQKRALESLSQPRISGGLVIPRVICWRDDFDQGRRFFGTIRDLRIKPRGVRGTYDVSFAFVESDFKEGTG